MALVVMLLNVASVVLFLCTIFLNAEHSATICYIQSSMILTGIVIGELFPVDGLRLRTIPGSAASASPRFKPIMIAAFVIYLLQTGFLLFLGNELPYGIAAIGTFAILALNICVLWMQGRNRLKRVAPPVGVSGTKNVPVALPRE